LRRAQVLKDKRRKSKVCVVKNWGNLQIYMSQRKSRLIAIEFKSFFRFVSDFSSRKYHNGYSSVGLDLAVV
jgi:hypothetical protein